MKLARLAVQDWAWLPDEFHREIERTHVVFVGSDVESEAVT